MDEPAGILAHYPVTVQQRWPRRALLDPAWAAAYRAALARLTPVGAAQAADRAVGRVSTVVDREGAGDPGR